MSDFTEDLNIETQFTKFGFDYFEYLNQIFFYSQIESLIFAPVKDKLIFIIRVEVSDKSYYITVTNDTQTFEAVYVSEVDYKKFSAIYVHIKNVTFPDRLFIRVSQTIKDKYFENDGYKLFENGDIINNETSEIIANILTAEKIEWGLQECIIYPKKTGFSIFKSSQKVVKIPIFSDIDVHHYLYNFLIHQKQFPNIPIN